MDYTQQIESGVALLNEHVPDWVNHIDVERLTVNNVYDCVLGQLPPYYGYDEMLFWLEGRLKRHVSRQCGFSGDAFGPDPDYSELTDQWKNKIRALQAAA